LSEAILSAKGRESIVQRPQIADAMWLQSHQLGAAGIAEIGKKVDGIAREEFSNLGLRPIGRRLCLQNLAGNPVGLFDHLKRGLDTHPADFAIKLGQPAGIQLILLHRIGETWRSRLNEIAVDLLPSLDFLRKPLALGLHALSEPRCNDGQNSTDDCAEQGCKRRVHDLKLR
jgi:hypothetical protein